MSVLHSGRLQQHCPRPYARGVAWTCRPRSVMVFSITGRSRMMGMKLSGPHATGRERQLMAVMQVLP